MGIDHLGLILRHNLAPVHCGCCTTYINLNVRKENQSFDYFFLFLMTMKIQINELPTQQVVRWSCESVRVFSFCCQLWHIRAFTGFGMSSLQVKVNTRNPTHGAAVSGLHESFLPGQIGIRGVNGGRGRGGFLCVSASAVPCGAHRGLSFSHRPLLFHTPLTCIPSLIPVFARSWFFLVPREHTSKQRHAPEHWHTLVKKDTQWQSC